MDSGWGKPILDAKKENAEEERRVPGEDGECPVCAWPLKTKNGKKVCNFCEWES